jgi:Domain of unknown function (DUF4365)
MIMSANTKSKTLDEVLTAFHMESDWPNAAILERYCRSYPQFAHEITEFAIAWAKLDSPDMRVVAETPINEPLLSRTETRLESLLYELDKEGARAGTDSHARVLKTASKTVPNSIFIGNEGAYLVPQIVNEMRFLWTPSAQFELGIDGTIEIVDPKTSRGTGNIIKVQVKTTSNPWAEETDDSFAFLVRQHDLDYWLSGNTPVILICCKAGSRETYWVPVKQYFEKAERRHERKIRFLKSRDCFSPACREALIDLAVPTDSGLYIASIPKEETLYSNLLPVLYFPETVFHASTECKDDKDAGALLRELAVDPPAEWIVTGDRFFSFHDISKAPWNEVCDSGDIEPMPTAKWAYSENAAERRQFVRLLNRCLSQKFKGERIWFNKKRQCYYFGADGTPEEAQARAVKEVSISRAVAKTVVRPYMSKTKPGHIFYWCHLAIERQFVLFGDQWYLQITPTYFFTSDGTHRKSFAESYLAGIKRLEKNSAVLRNVLTWANFLQPKDDWFAIRYELLKFGPLLNATLDFGIADQEWLTHAEEEEAEELRNDLSLSQELLL